MINKLTPTLTLDQLSQLCLPRLDNLFTPYLQAVPSLELKTAMEYSLMQHGKRLRPLLIYATGSLFHAPLENLDIAAVAVELIHTYSLIHDDLPSMDNADLRRGQPTCHKVHGEAMAILTGDALQALAMQILASHPAPLKDQRRLQMMQILCRASGPFGMAAGQAMDITLMGDHNLSLDTLMTIYPLKTGALFSACIELGRLSSNDENAVNQQALNAFGDLLGLAFQIQDDILDIEASSHLSGKPQGLDLINHKNTYPKLRGVAAAKEKVESLYEEALRAIHYFGDQAQLLRELSHVMLQRRQ